MRFFNDLKQHVSTEMTPLREQLPAPEGYKPDNRTISEKAMEAVDIILEDLGAYKEMEIANIAALTADRDDKNRLIKEAEARLREAEDILRDVRPASEKIAMRTGGQVHSIKEIIAAVKPEPIEQEAV